MQEETQKGISKSKICFLSVLSIITMAAAITMVVLLCIWGYIGFDGGSPIVLGTCTNNYNLMKYSNLTLMIKVIFVASAVAAFCSCLIFIIMMVWTVRKCKNNGQTTNQVGQCTRNFMYFLISLMLLASLVPVAYYLSFIVEMDSCSPTKNNNQLLILLIIASSVFAFSFLVWIILGCSLCDYSSEDKYRQKQKNSNQSKEQKQHKKIEENLPIRRYNPRIIKHEQTKENIFESSPIKRQQPKYKGRNQIQDFQPQNIVEIQNLMNQNIPLNTKHETPVLNLHPLLRPKRKWLNQNNQKYIPTIKQPLYDRNQSQQNERSRAYNMRSDQESLKREEKRYLSRPEGGILPLSGVRKKDYKHYRNDSDEADGREMSKSQRDQRRERDRYYPDRVNLDKSRREGRYRDDRQGDRNYKQQYRDSRQERVRKDDRYEQDDRYNNSRRSPPRQKHYQDQRSARGKQDYKNYRDRYGRDDYMGAIDPSHYQDTHPRRRGRS